MSIVLACSDEDEGSGEGVDCRTRFEDCEIVSSARGLALFAALHTSLLSCWFARRSDSES